MRKGIANFAWEKDGAAKNKKNSKTKSTLISMPILTSSKIAAIFYQQYFSIFKFFLRTIPQIKFAKLRRQECI